MGQGMALRAQSCQARGFRDLFAIHGRTNGRDSWRKGFLPTAIADDFEVRYLLDLPAVRRVVSSQKMDHGVQLSGLERLDPHDLNLLHGLCWDANGRNGSGLALRKNPGAWSRLESTTMDRLIPEEVSAEFWRAPGGTPHLSVFEWAMAGSVSQARDLAGFVAHLWGRLGLVEEPAAAQVLQAAWRQMAHVWWHPQIAKLPSDSREPLFRALVGAWGDKNDAVVIDWLTGRPFGSSDGSEAAFAKTSRTLHEQASTRYTVAPLLQHTFSRVAATPDGLWLRLSEEERGTCKDRNFPSVLKWLPVGLRSLPSSPVVLPGGHPVSQVAIEGRVYTLRENLAMMPKTLPGSDAVDPDALFEHDSAAPRGLLTLHGEGGLKTRLLEMQPGGRVAAKIEQLFAAAEVAATQVWKRNTYHAWRADCTIGLAFAPMMDWLHHPLAQRQLVRLGSAAAGKARQRYQRAFGQYLTRLEATSVSNPGDYLLLDLFENAARFATEAKLAKLVPLD